MFENKEPYLLLFEERKRKFVQTNLIVEIFILLIYYYFIYLYNYYFIKLKLFYLCVCFFETKNIYSHTHSTYAGGEVIKKISPGQFPETALLFWS